MRLRSSVIVIAVGVIAVAAASVVSMYPSLSDARDAVEEEWGRVHPQLDQRYDRLAALSRAVRAAQADFELLDEVDDAVGGWKAMTRRRPTPDSDEEPPAANRVEGAGARLARSVTVKPSLRANGDVVLALREYLGVDPRPSLEAFNESVERYDRARSRFPGPFFASILGFDALNTVEVPGALFDLDVPEPPPEPATTTTPAP